MRQFRHSISKRFVAVVLALGIMALALVAVGVTPAHAQGGTYVVQPGDSLFLIAARFNVGLSDLATINGLTDVHRVFVGQVLRLPSPLPGRPAPSVPDTGVPVGVPGYTPGTTVTVVTTYRAYTVRQGDTLSGIAERFGSSIALILSANGLSNADFVFVGQHLTIPIARTTVVPGQPAARPSHPVLGPGRVYVVNPGDTLFAIANAFRRNAWDIARVNGILNLNHIYVGQRLRIP